MNRNEASWDRSARAVVGVVLIVLALAVFDDVGAVIAGIGGAILVVTAAIGWCPLYRLFGVSTHRSG